MKGVFKDPYPAFGGAFTQKVCQFGGIFAGKQGKVVRKCANQTKGAFADTDLINVLLTEYN